MSIKDKIKQLMPFAQSRGGVTKGEVRKIANLLIECPEVTVLDLTGHLLPVEGEPRKRQMDDELTKQFANWVLDESKKFIQVLDPTEFGGESNRWLFSKYHCDWYPEGGKYFYASKHEIIARLYLELAYNDDVEYYTGYVEWNYITIIN